MGNYQNFLDDCKYWIDKSQQRIENIEIDPNDSEKLKETKLILEDAKSQLVDMKEKIESCEELANKLNKSTSLIGQDEIQSEIKSLYEFYENYMDILHEHNKNINYLLDSREMYFEHKNQLENWIHNMKIKLNKIDLDNTLEEKRINYLLNKSLVQEIKANEHAVNSLQNKGKPVNNYDYEKDNELLKSEFDTLLHQANVHMDVSEKVYEDHMNYNTNFNYFENVLKTMKDKLFSLSQVVGDKYSYHAKLEKLQELSCSIDTMDNKLEKLRSDSLDVLKTTGHEGKVKLNQELEIINNEWIETKNQLDDSQNALKNDLYLWQNFDEKCENYNRFMKDTELQLRSIEFKPTIETKSEQFSQLEILQEQLNSEEKILEELGPNFNCIEIEETRLSNSTLQLKKKSDDNYNEIFNSLESKEKEI